MQAGMLGAVVVLILAIVTIACYAIYRHRREKIRSGIIIRHNPVARYSWENLYDKMRGGGAELGVR